MSWLLDISDLASSIISYTRIRDPLLRDGVVRSNVFGSDGSRELQFSNFKVYLNLQASMKHEVSVRKTLSNDGSGSQVYRLASLKPDQTNRRYEA